MSKVQSIDRALLLVDIVSKYGTISLNDLVQESNLSKTTVHRLANSLIENKYLMIDPITKQYSLSYKLFQLGQTSIQNIDYLSIAKSLISRLSVEVNETCHLVIEDEGEILYIEKFTPEIVAHHTASRTGQRAPMYCTSVGKSILSTYSDNEIKELWEKTDIQSYTENTIVNFDDFMKEINKVRQQGFAEDLEENEYGTFCVGSYFKNYKNKVQGAISLSFPSKHYDKKDFYIEKLQEVANKISKHLGAM